MNNTSAPPQTPEQRSLIGRLIGFCLSNKLIVALFVMAIIMLGLFTAPFDWDLGGIKRYPVPTDAIPDIGENQQIVFTQWMGRSPQDVEDQITYPLTVSLLGVPGVKTIRSTSMFGFSSIFVIFKEDVEFYWSRTRVLEKLNSLPPGTLPDGVRPALGPDATGLGQIYWYTLEGRDPNGNPAGGWDLEELRTVQDWYARYHIMSADGVAEVGSIGGYVREYQVDVDPDAMRAYGVTLAEVSRAIKTSNIDVGAKTIEINRVEYFIRGIGFLKGVDDIANSVIKVRENVPVLIKHIAKVSVGPATRRGSLDKEGAQAVGAVVVARYGDNPLRVIKNVKAKIEQTKDSLPAKAVIDFLKVSRAEVVSFAQANGFDAYDGAKFNQSGWLNYLRTTDQQSWPAWATISKVTIIPFYDRTGLIYETLGTLNDAISQEILITVIVIIVMVMHLRSSLIIGCTLPLAVLLCFVGMKVFGVDANIVALSGIVIAIGTIVDMGIVVCENTLRHLEIAPPDEPRLAVVHRAASEVGGAVLTAVLTTVVSFLPVFTMTGAEGKLFKPLAYTKTFALFASVIIALTVIPPAAYILFCGKISGRKLRHGLMGLLGVGGLALVVYGLMQGSLMIVISGLAVVAFAAHGIAKQYIPARFERLGPWVANTIVVVLVGVVLTKYWNPLGPERGLSKNLFFVGLLIGSLLGFFWLFRKVYSPILRWCLRHKIAFLSLPMLLVVLGVWAFSSFGTEFMPSLDEGSFLYMPTTMVHASMGEALDIVATQDIAFSNIPEVESVVGKLGRADTPLDPAPISMIETVINYKSEYITNKAGRRVKFKYDRSRGQFIRDERGELIADSDGRPFRQWRDHITTPDDIWEEILKAGKIPGTTSAPKLQPIATRLIMLQSGMRSPMGVKIFGPTLESIEMVGLEIERLLKEVPSVKATTVVADRIVGKPYLEIVPDRRALARYGVPIRAFQDVVEIAIGGKKLTTTLEGRERFPVRVRYQRELRDSIEKLDRILVPGSGGAQIPIVQLAEIRYVRGPQAIKSEDTFKVAYVVFDKNPGKAEVNVVQECQRYLQSKIDSGELIMPAGVSYKFAGNYENQLRAAQTLSVILPVALFVIFMIIYFQFKSLPTTFLIFIGIFVAWAGGFLMMWLYNQPWFMDFSVFDVNLRTLFQMPRLDPDTNILLNPINISVAVWVGFLALFGIASDNGVIQSTYLDQIFRDRKPSTIDEIREATITAAKRRVRPCLMTSATTILALIPVLTSTGRGSDIMVPMAIPSFGGMLIVLISIFVVPVLYCLTKEIKLKIGSGQPGGTVNDDAVDWG